MGDDIVVRRWYAAQLAPPAVTGMRALVDSASLLWRAQLAGAWSDELPIDDVLSAVDRAIMERPRTAFAALHVAVARAAAGDSPALGRLARYAESTGDVVMVVAVTPVVRGLQLLVDGRPSDAADALAAVLAALWRVGGSAAQREVVEDTLLFCLLEAGRYEPARALLERRLDRRPSPREMARIAGIGPVRR
jgi:hypothetical protein